jgi:hypothetical protein
MARLMAKLTVKLQVAADREPILARRVCLDNPEALADIAYRTASSSFCIFLLTIVSRWLY